jgi:glycosyltransferase involved in cell wall biosynthesis
MSADAKPLRILQIVESAATGVGRHVIDLVSAAEEVGHVVDVIYSPLREDDLFRKSRAGTPSQFTAVEMRRAPGPGDMAALWKVQQKIARSGPYDIIHGHSSKGGMMARLVGIGRSASVLFTPHAISTLDPTLKPIPRFVYHRGEWTLALLTDAIIAVSGDERDHIVQLGVPARKVVLIANATDAPVSGPREEIRRQLNLLPDQVAIGFVGRLSRQKAIDVMIEAFARINPPGRAKLIVIGEGEAGEAARQRAAELGRAEDIVWLGSVDARWYYSAFDILALPSLYEGFSYTALEAFGAGLPIIASEVGGIRDIVIDGQTGIIVKPGDVNALTASLSRVVHDADVRARFAAATSAQFAKTGGRQRMVDATFGLYHSLVDARRRASGRI